MYVWTSYLYTYVYVIHAFVAQCIRHVRTYVYTCAHACTLVRLKRTYVRACMHVQAYVRTHGSGRSTCARVRMYQSIYRKKSICQCLGADLAHTCSTVSRYFGGAGVPIEPPGCFGSLWGRRRQVGESVSCSRGSARRRESKQARWSSRACRPGGGWGLPFWSRASPAPRPAPWRGSGRWSA